MFGLSRQALHKRAKKQIETTLENEIVLQLITPYRKIMPRIGTRKLYALIKMDLAAMNINMGRDKFFALLREENMLVHKKKKFTKTTNSMHRFRKHRNLIKDKVIREPEEVWVGDITYIDTEEGYHYLSLITDYYSKQILGYHLSDNLKTEGALKALEMAISSRIYPKRQLIHHSDRGFQYCSYEYTGTLTENNIQISMTEKQDPYENAVAERINGILKDEFDVGGRFVNYAQAIREIKASIETYNKFRPHQSCNMLTPEQAHLVGKYELKKWNKRWKEKQKETKKVI
ncbi:MAG: IS3 family transposase [Bacteroidales bacterium]|nr:IS3 family transposase [Bacteroidales bacterium]